MHAMEVAWRRSEHRPLQQPLQFGVSMLAQWASRSSSKAYYSRLSKSKGLLDAAAAT